MSPFLFLWWQSEVLNAEIEALARRLLKEYNIDTNSLFHLSNTGENLKIEEVRTFIEKSHQKPRFQFQIFFIENIGRMTLQSANASLKFLEEPWKWNIIFLTNNSEAEVLDTILSRVQIVRHAGTAINAWVPSYTEMIRAYFNENDTELISFLYTQKHEKEVYQDILASLFDVLSSSGNNPSVLWELEKDMQGLQKNNLNGKYIIDKYLA